MPEKRGILSRAFRTAFENPSPRIEAITQRWVALSPGSAFALQARGMYYVAAASEARGDHYMRDTPERNRAAMRELIAKAATDFTAALAINPRLITAYSGLIVAARLTGDHELVESSVNSALALDIADDRTYLDWMTASEPRWGGSPQAMLAVAAKAKQHVDMNPLLNLVLEKPNSYIGIQLQNNGDDAAAIGVFDRALLTAPSVFDFKMTGYAADATHQPERAIWYFSEAYRFSNDLESFSERTSALIALGHTDWAKETLPESYGLKGQDTRPIYSLAGTLWRLGMMPEAEKQYARILEINPRNEDALVALSMLYLHNPPRPEKAQPLIDHLVEYYPNNARGWLLDSVGKPDAECHRYLKRYLELVDPSDPYEQADILRVKKRLAQLDHALKQT